jgi:hypothetical protein
MKGFRSGQSAQGNFILTLLSGTWWMAAGIQTLKRKSRHAAGL